LLRRQWDLDGGIRQAAPSHPVKPATAIPSPEKFLDPPAHSMDLPVPYSEPRQRSLLIFAHTAVVSMRHAWRAGFREYRVSKIRAR